MPRKAGPWYRASRRMWYATVDGVQIALDVRGEENYPAAVESLRLLLEAARKPPAAPPPSPRTRELANAFLARKEGRVSAECLRQYRITLTTHFLPVFGDRTLASLTPEELEDWADRPAWSSSTRNNNLGVIQTFLKWAGRPLAIRRPPKESRGASAVLSDTQFARLLACYHTKYRGDLPQLLRCLRLTGARPSELATLTVEEVDWDNACLRRKKHKTARHGGERVIHFSAAAVAILASQRAKWGTGHLFRTRNGRAYVAKQWGQQMRKLSKRAGVRAIAYGERHAFATAALVAGVPDAVVAELLGHKGTGMVARHYGHVSGQSRVLKDAVEKVNRPKAG